MAHIYDLHIQIGAQKISLTQEPYIYRSQTLVDFQLGYNFSRAGVDFVGRYGTRDTLPRERSVVVQCVANSRQELSDIVHDLTDKLSYEMIENRMVYFWIGDYYLPVRITSATPEVKGISSVAILTVTVLPETSLWTKDHTFTMEKGATSGDPEADEDTKKYPYKYPYKYARLSAFQMTNPTKRSADMLIRIFGAAASPSINIGGSQYKIKTNIYENERLEINTLKRTIVKFDSVGNQSNQFQNRVGDVFNKIPTGVSAVESSANFRFDVVVFDQVLQPRIGGA